MHLIDGAGHVNNTFVSEDAPSGQPPTEITPEIMNALQFEIANVVEGAGLPLVKVDNTQLLSAIRKMIQAGQRSVVINNAVFAPAVTGTGKPVYWDSANSCFDLAIADGSGKQNVVGFADVPNSNVYAFGDAVLFSGLTPGARYYLDTTASGIVTTAPSNAVFLGIARTSTEMFIDVDVASYAPLKSPDFTDPSTNTPDDGDKSRKIPNTLWIWNNISALVAGCIGAIATAAGFGCSFGPNGYFRTPVWLGGWVIQWGYVAKPSSAAVPVTWPVAFPNGFGRCVAGFGGSNSPNAGVSCGSPGLTGATFYSTVGGTGYDISYIVVGW